MTEQHQQTPGRRYAQGVEDLGYELGVVLTEGLAEEEAARRFSVLGPNELPEAPPLSPWKILAGQFTSLIVWVLIGAAIISGLLGEWIDTGAILAIVVLNGCLGFVQEYRAEQSLAALKTLAVTHARVIREGARRTVPSRELVPGDLIEVEAGDHIPADARLIHAAALRTQEAALTGESAPVPKGAATLSTEDVPLGDRSDMLFQNTSVTSATW